jgi:hypothetical protein
MDIKPPMTPIVALGLLLAGSSAADPLAVPCVFLPKGVATVNQAGKDWTPPVRFDDCRQTKIKSGRVSACFMTSNGVRTCKTFTAGQTLKSDDLGFVASGSFTLGTAVLDMLRGDAETRAGQTRAPSGTLGFPYGAILGLAEFIEIRPATPQSTSFDLFDVAQMNQPIFASVVGEIIRIPTASLRSSTSYRWRARTGTATYSGAFLVAGPESDLTRTQAKAIAADDTLSPIERHFLLADLLDQEGFLFERDQLIEELLTQHLSVL